MWGTSDESAEDNRCISPELRAPIEVYKGPEEQWSLDYTGMKKLKSIILHVQNRKITANPYVDMNRAEIRMRKIEDFVKSEKGEYIKNRLSNLGTSNANRYAILGDEFKLRKELESGFPVNSRDRITGRTLLHEATGSGHFHIVKILCSDFGANVNCTSMLGSATALHIAVDSNFRQIASLLITYGANVNAKDKFGSTPVFYARSLPLLKLLLRYDVDVCARNLNRLTAAQYYEKVVASNNFVPEIVQILNHKQIEKENQIKAAEAALRKQLVKKTNKAILKETKRKILKN